MTDTEARPAAAAVGTPADNQAGAHLNRDAFAEAKDFLPLDGIDHVEFWVGNARQASAYFRALWGFTPVAFSGLETGVRDRASYVMQQHDIRIVLTAPLTPDGEIADHVRQHGDGVRDIAFAVSDVASSFRETTERAVRHRTSRPRVGEPEPHDPRTPQRRRRAVQFVPPVRRQPAGHPVRRSGRTRLAVSGDRQDDPMPFRREPGQRAAHQQRLVVRVRVESHQRVPGSVGVLRMCHFPSIARPPRAARLALRTLSAAAFHDGAMKPRAPRRVVTSVLSGLATAALVVLLPRAVGATWSEVGAVLGRVSAGAVVALAVVWIAGLWAHSFVLAASLPGLTKRRGLTLSLTGSAVANVLPLGGAAGTFISPKEIDVPLTFEGTRSIGATLGSGVVMLLDDSVDLKRILLRIAAFFRHETCGQCVPCRVGVVRQQEALQRLVDNRPMGSKQDELAMVKEMAQAMRDASICGLGQTAASAVESALQRWNVFA